MDKRHRIAAVGSVVALIGAIAAIAIVLATGDSAPSAADAAPVTTPDPADKPATQKPAPVSKDQRQAMSFAARYRMIGARLAEARKKDPGVAASIGQTFAEINYGLALRDPAVRVRAMATLAEVDRALRALE